MKGKQTEKKRTKSDASALMYYYVCIFMSVFLRPARICALELSDTLPLSPLLTCSSSDLWAMELSAIKTTTKFRAIREGTFASIIAVWFMQCVLHTWLSSFSWLLSLFSIDLLSSVFSSWTCSPNRCSGLK